MNILLLMAGGNKLFEEAGYPYPKNLIEIDGIPLVQHVLSSLAELEKMNSRLICFVNREENQRNYTGSIISLLDPQAIVIEVNEPTIGAACTALLAVEHINKSEPLVIVNGDQIINGDLSSIVMKFQSQDCLDGGIIVFEAVHPRWSYVRCNSEGLVIEAAEKRPISKLATAGFYYFARGEDFVSSAKQMIRKDAHINGSFYVCPVYNELILKQLKIGVHEIPRKDYFSLSTPQNLQFYEKYFHLKSAEMNDA
jgi:dTDP-glucose pyrophosphorylase